MHGVVLRKGGVFARCLEPTIYLFRYLLCAASQSMQFGSTSCQVCSSGGGDLGQSGLREDNDGRYARKNRSLLFGSKASVIAPQKMAASRACRGRSACAPKLHWLIALLVRDDGVRDNRRTGSLRSCASLLRQRARRLFHEPLHLKILSAIDGGLAFCA